MISNGDRGGLDPTISFEEVATSWMKYSYDGYRQEVIKVRDILVVRGGLGYVGVLVCRREGEVPADRSELSGRLQEDWLQGSTSFGSVSWDIVADRASSADICIPGVTNGSTDDFIMDV